MANDRQTTNYLDLILPKGPEYYSVQDGNTNFTILDTKIEEIVNSITSLNININSTIKKVVADLIGGATEGIDSLKDILDLLNDPESGELVKINEAINQRLTIESFDQFKTEHTKVHDTVNGRLTAIDDPVTGSVAVEQTARIAADEALNEKIGSLELLKTSNKEDVINAINEIVGNIGTLTSLKTSVKTSIVNAINSNKESIDALTTDTSDYNSKNGFYFYNLKNVLISDKSDDCYSYSNVSGNTYAFDIALKNIKLFYYGKIIDINQTYRMQTPTTGTYVIYVGMQINETDYMSNNDTGYTILETSGEDLAISPSNWVIGCERSATNNENIPITLPDDGLIHNGVVFKQPLIRISVTNSTSGSTINSISWVNDNNLPTLDYTNYYDYVNGIYRLVEENLGDTINSKIDELNEIVGKSNSFGGFTGGSSAFATTGGAVGNKASAFSGGAIGQGASAISGGAVGFSASATTGGAVGSGAKTSAGFAGGYNAKTQDSSGDGIDAIQLGSGTNSTAKTLQVYEYQLMDANGNIPKERLMDNLNSYYTITGTTTFGYHMIAKVKDITKPMYAEVICGFYPKNDHTCIGKISIYYSPVNEKKGICKCIENYVSHETDDTTQSASIGLLNVNNEVYIYMYTGSVLFNYNYYYYNISGVNIEIFDTDSFMTTSYLESNSAIRLSSASVNSSSPIIGRFVADTPTPI